MDGSRRILRQLCKAKKEEIIEVEAFSNHTYMQVRIPTYLRIAQFMGYEVEKHTVDIRSKKSWSATREDFGIERIHYPFTSDKNK